MDDAELSEILRDADYERAVAGARQLAALLGHFRANLLAEQFSEDESFVLSNDYFRHLLEYNAPSFDAEDDDD